MDETTWFWLGCAGMTVGAAALAVTGKRRTQDEEGHTVVHVVVPLLAALSYFAMAVGQGATTVGERTFIFARYVDWSITTPLLLLALSMTALHGAHRRPGLVAALLGADVLMIVTGFFSGASSAGGTRWTWFLVSCGAFAAVYATLLGPLRREADRRDDVRRSAYRRNLTLLAVLWLVYPVVDLLGPDGSGAWSSTTATACFTVVDLLAKVAYGFVASAGSARIAEHDLGALGRDPEATVAAA